MKCLNCYASKTPQWRKINLRIYCNACAMHYKRLKTHKIDFIKLDLDIIYCASILIDLKKEPI